jgi:hypothetical protein
MNKITSFLQKSFQSLRSSIILPLSKISYYLVKCAKSHSYIETLGKHADSLHLWINKSYEEDFKRSFEIQVKEAVKHLHVSHAKLAFDTTSEPFYGKTRGLYLFDTHEEKYKYEFRFISVCLITRNKQIPLMALPVHLGSITAKLIIELMEYCKSIFKKISFALFDRGFYIAELIDYLEANKIKYLILVPEKKGSITGYVEQTKELGKFKHIMEYTKDKSTWRPKTTIVVCKGIDDFAWIFATNIHFNSRVEYILHYKRRWQIETNYRVEDESHIKSKSTNYLIRYFYFFVSLLFHLLWIVNKNLNYYVPFKKYLDIIEQKMFFGYLEIPQI